MPSFVEESRRQNKGVVFGHKTKTDEQIAKELGRYPTLAPGGSVRIESFAHDNKVRLREGAVACLHVVSLLCTRSSAVGCHSVTGESPRLGECGLRVHCNLTSDVWRVRLKSDMEMAQSLGRWSRLGPGGSYRVPSFVHDNQVQNKGVVFGNKLKSRMEMLQAIGYAGWHMTLVASALTNIVGVSLYRYPFPPAPGGNCKVPSFVADNIAQNKGVIFGNKLKSQAEINQALGIAETPAPGGNTRVPSFVEDNIAQNKGVQFGDRFKSEAEIAENLGRLSRLAPGGQYRIPSFVHDNKVQNKGIVFGNRHKTETEIAGAIKLWLGSARLVV